MNELEILNAVTKSDAQRAAKRARAITALGELLLALDADADEVQAALEGHCVLPRIEAGQVIERGRGRAGLPGATS